MIIFGCETYTLISKDRCSKLYSRSNKYVFVGYNDGVKGYRLWDPTSHKIIIRKYVVFDESSLIKSNMVDVEERQEHVPQVQQIQLETQPSSLVKYLNRSEYKYQNNKEYQQE
jgi:hypothetical protein